MKLAFTLILAVAGLVSYPQTPRSDVTQTFFGTMVNDPYHWLERTESPAVKQWVTSQTALTSHILEGIPDRDFFEKRITQLHTSGRDSEPSVGTYASVFLNGSGDVMVQRNGGTHLLLDPKKRWPGSTRLADWSLSPDGLKLAA
jgi:prolyl oligopeptidase